MSQLGQSQGGGGIPPARTAPKPTPRMPGNAGAWSGAEINAALAHSLQRQTLRRVADRLSDLRSCRSDHELYDFQLTLFDDLHWAQEKYASASRSLKRLDAGKTVDLPEAGDWRLEMWIRHRIEREFRSVGDCLAWKFFDCDRRYPTIFSRHQDPGLLHGKSGTDAERRRAEQILRQEGRFALMNDLTLSFRTGDLTVRRINEVQIEEVKADLDRSTSRQAREIRRDIEAASGAVPLEFEGVPLRVPVSTVRIRTALEALRTTSIAAHTVGPQATALSDQWILLVQSAPRPVPTSVEEYWLPLQERARADAGLTKPGPVFTGDWSWHAWNSKNSWVSGAPFGIYPLPPAHCAALTCGYLIYQTVLGYDRLKTAFEDLGYETKCLLPPEPRPIAPEDLVMSVSKQIPNRILRFILKTAAFNQIQFELFTPECVAAAMDEVFSASTAFPETATGLIAHGSLAFSNERSIWMV